MSHHGGLTLLEVLAATVLLSMLAAAAVPILTQAQESLHQSNLIDQIQVQHDLSEIADTFMDDPERFGMKDTQAILAAQTFEIQWNLASELSPAISHNSSVRVRCWRPPPESLLQAPPEVLQPMPPAIPLENNPEGTLKTTVHSDHIWLIFEFGGQAVSRWLALPPMPEAPGARQP